ncbi:adenine-specific methyltransferase EcoRI family protein, partial [Flavobacterium psychrophilum]|uniref:adenine-specific methyltransferase EcoRI family protein n=2 Tax=Flavobacterium psychrophilum TaxID=96345 RepID=UPI00293D4C36
RNVGGKTNGNSGLKTTVQQKKTVRIVTVKRTIMAVKAQNKNLHSAKSNKKDEFYTQLSDIEKELKHYKNHFKDKVVLCNCDDPRVSNFFHFFSYNFERFGLKKLIATCYKSQDADLFSENKSERAIYLEYDGDKNGDNIPNPEEIGIRHLQGDGDFRSKECIELLKQADIIVTNPPFSLFREYVAQLVEYDKKFVIIGNLNALTYRDIFKPVKENKLWFGHSIHSGDREFRVPEDYTLSASSSRIDEIGNKFIRVKGVRWYTNLDFNERHEDLILYKTYNEDEYPKYENFDAINVNITKDIPVDYSGAMGVPITFIDKFNPDQFEIIGLGISNSGLEAGVQPYKPEHKKYRKEIQKRGAVDGDLYMMKNGIVEVPYARILIRNKKI